MKKLKMTELCIAFALSVTFSAASFATQSDANDGKIITSTQVVQLIQGTPTYNIWAAWIRAETAHDARNYDNYKNGVPISKSISTEVDLITIKTTTAPVTAKAPLETGNYAFPDASAPSGPPMPLPVKGTPGQRITITSQTRNYYASWTYVWVGDGDGNYGGWDLVSSSFHDCGDDPNRPEGVRCEQN